MISDGKQPSLFQFENTTLSPAATSTSAFITSPPTSAGNRVIQLATVVSIMTWARDQYCYSFRTFCIRLSRRERLLRNSCCRVGRVSSGSSRHSAISPCF
ncbi:hypothetical protein L596_007340 [Steinernema carpocapsae]|uniref:Uncharacterized protein n=1 Tax=Steinernema carpocapsae TaxID=34508 RepID=A0A4U5PA09_STECR|nr:hypothetical protein L596_007340 [Steinernema carpocapsae]